MPRPRFVPFAAGVTLATIALGQTPAPDAAPRPERTHTAMRAIALAGSDDRRRAIMRSLATAFRSAPGPGAAPVAHGVAANLLALSPEAGFGHPNDRAAIAEFAAAATDVLGSEAVLGFAVSAPTAAASQRALLGVWRAWRPRPHVSDRTGELLTALADHPDDGVAALGACVLALQLRAGFTRPLPALVARAHAAWPVDESELVPASGLAPAPGMSEYTWDGDRRSRLVLLAMHAGDAALVDRVAAQPAGAPPIARRRAHFTLLALAIAAPHVDAATARRIHGWYMPHVDAWDRSTKALTTWHCGVLAALVGVQPRLPAELLPSYAPLRDWPLLRDHVDGQLGGLLRAPDAAADAAAR